MRLPFQVVPWYNVEEWHEVYNRLYGPNSSLATKQEGLDHLLIWKARCPTLPSGIESTLTLLEVHLQDENKCYQKSNDYIMRLAYSSSLIRFVNHMVDTETSKGLNLFRAAKNIGIPDWIIELRHDTAHSERLPPIEQLREACVISLEWLQKNYWDKHKQCIENFTIEKIENGELENKIEAIINFCLSLSICSHSRCKIKKITDIKDIKMRESLVNDSKDLLGSCVNFSNLESVTIQALIDAMNIMVRKLFNTEIVSQHVNKVLIYKDSPFLSLEVHNLLDYYNFELTKSLSKQYVQCFARLLDFLHTNEILQDFVLELIKFTQDEQNCNRKRKLAARWVSTILQAWRKNQKFMERLKKTETKDVILKNKNQIKSLYFHWYPNEKENSIFLDLRKSVPKDMTDIIFIQPIISAYNSNLIYFIKDLLNLVRPRLPGIVIEKICNLAKVVACPQKFPATSSRIYTVDDLKSIDSISSSDNLCEVVECNKMDDAIDPIKNNSNEENHERFGIWQVASNNFDWSLCPLGQLPWQLPHTEPMET